MYLDEIAARIGNEDPLVLAHELAEALDEMRARDPGAFNPRTRDLHELVRFCNHDAIAEWLRTERPGVERALAFAEKHGEEKVATLLRGALAGKPERKPIFTAMLGGIAKKILNVPTPEVCILDGKDYGGTDLALAFAMDGFVNAVIAELVAAKAEIALDPPLRVQQRSQANAVIGERAAARSPRELLHDLVAAPRPRILAGTWEAYEARDASDATRIAIKHAAYAAPSERLLAKAAEKFGPASREILEAYALHDGAELFLANGEPGFFLAPITQWPELLARAVEWAEGVTYHQEPEEIPKALYSAIAFGLIPGDSERWLLITEGEHAGKVMLSDSDLPEGDARFDSFGEFLACLLVDAPRILNCGGHVRYPGKRGQELFAIRYEAG
jgi:hypothetical protein